MKNFLKNSGNKAVSLIEMAIILAIIGLLIGGVFKGSALIEQSRLQKTVMQIENIRSSVDMFRESYQSPPGSFAEASQYLGCKAEYNGSGNGFNFQGQPLEKDSDGNKFWMHLYLARLLFKPNYKLKNGAECPQTPLGGIFTVEYRTVQNKEGLFLILGEEKGSHGRGPLLSGEKAKTLVKMLEKSGIQDSHIFLEDGEGVPSGSCLGKNDSFSKKACIVYVFICD